MPTSGPPLVAAKIAQRHARPVLLAGAMISAKVRTGSAKVSGLQLAFELVEETPVRSVGQDLLRGRLDHAGLLHAQCIEPHAVFGVEHAPLVVLSTVQRPKSFVIVG